MSTHNTCFGGGEALLMSTQNICLRGAISFSDLKKCLILSYGNNARSILAYIVFAGIVFY